MGGRSSESHRVALDARDRAYRNFGQFAQDEAQGLSQVPLEEYEEDDPMDDLMSIRGEAWSDFLSCLTSPLLRLGFLMQFLVLVFGFALFYGHGGTGVFTFDLFSTPRHLRDSEAYNTIMMVLESVYLGGCLCIAGFQTLYIEAMAFQFGGLSPSN